LHSGELHNFTHHQILLGRSNQGDWGGRGMWHHGRGEKRVNGFGGKGRRKNTTWMTKV
jgi:hypothetical protein